VDKTDLAERAGRRLVRRTPEALPAGSRTVPAGRFLVDLPADACARFGRQGFNEAGPFIQVLPVPGPAAAQARVEAQAASLGVPHEEGGTRLEQVVEGRLPNSWFIYFWKDTAFKDETLVLNGFFWREGLLFVFQNTCGTDPAAMADRACLLETLFRRVRRRSLLEVPPGPGFCLREAYFPGKPARFSDEHIELLVTFPASPGLSMRLRTDTVGEVIASYPPLLERGRTGHPLRARERPVGAFAGQELVQRVSHPGGVPGWRCAWECLGQPRDPLAPMLMLDLKTGGRTGIGEGEILELWDAVLGSLRPRENFLSCLRLPQPFRSS
jgi:hypothetical protein